MGLTAHTGIRPGRESEVFRLLAGFINAARAEPGCFAFALAERWSSAHFTEVLLGKIVPFLNGRSVEEYDVPD